MTHHLSTIGSPSNEIREGSKAAQTCFSPPPVRHCRRNGIVTLRRTPATSGRVSFSPEQRGRPDLTLRRFAVQSQSCPPRLHPQCRWDATITGWEIWPRLSPRMTITGKETGRCVSGPLPGSAWWLKKYARAAAHPKCYLWLGFAKLRLCFGPAGPPTPTQTVCQGTNRAPNPLHSVGHGAE